MSIAGRIVTVVLSVGVALGAMPAVAEEGIYVGIYSDDWSAGQDIAELSSLMGAQFTFVGTFHHLLEGPENTNWILEQAWQAGGTPVANLEVNQLSYSVAAQHHDDEIRDWAIDVLTWLERGEGRSLIIAPMAEANGDWVSWGMDPGNYQIGFVRIVEIFRQLGIDGSQVRWMFAPNSVSTGNATINDYWPGDQYVDILGFSAYNFGDQNWLEPAEIYDPAVEELAALAPDKPIIIAQTGSASHGGDKDAWIERMFAYVAHQPDVVGFVYFNFDKERDWKVWRDGELAEGWSEGVRRTSVAHSQPLTGWFRSGPIAFDPATPMPQRAASGRQPAFSGKALVAIEPASVVWASPVPL